MSAMNVGSLRVAGIDFAIVVDPSIEGYALHVRDPEVIDVLAGSIKNFVPLEQRLWAERPAPPPFVRTAPLCVRCGHPACDGTSHWIMPTGEFMRIVFPP